MYRYRQVTLLHQQFVGCQSRENTSPLRTSALRFAPMRFLDQTPVSADLSIHQLEMKDLAGQPYKHLLFLLTNRCKMDLALKGSSDPQVDSSCVLCIFQACSHSGHTVYPNISSHLIETPASLDL